MIANRSVPDASVIPVLAYPDVAEATEWLCSAFGRRLAGEAPTRFELVYEALQASA